jgi:hypothetical protein
LEKQLFKKDKAGDERINTETDIKEIDVEDVPDSSELGLALHMLIKKRQIPWSVTGRPLLVGEVSANFCTYRAPHRQRDGSLRPYSRFSRPELLLFFQAAPQLYSQYSIFF